MKAIHLRYAIYGLALGFALGRAGFSDFAELHKMFTFADLRLLMTFAGAVTVALIGFALLDRGLILARREISGGNVFGGLLFGAGWAITGACPSIALVNFGEGKLAAIATIIGIALGAWIYPTIQRRFYPWTVTSCDV